MPVKSEPKVQSPYTSYSLETPVSEMTYTVSSGTLNPSIPYHSLEILHFVKSSIDYFD